MMPGETIRSGASPACDCGTKFEMEIMKSPAGWYVGTMCRTPGCEFVGQPNSRESHYYGNKAELQQDMKTGRVRWRE